MAELIDGPTFDAPLRCWIDGGVGHVHLDRPDKLNALTPATLDAVSDAVVWLDDRAEARCIVVSGAGRAFCAGFDLTAFAAPDADTVAVAESGLRAAHAIDACTTLTIAAIQGHCVGGGVVLAAACDMRIAAADATFALPEAALGIPLTWGGVPLLVRAVGPAATTDLILTCRTIGASEAHNLGLASRVVDDLGRATDEITAAVVARSALTVSATKRSVRRVVAGLRATDLDEWSDDVDLLVQAFADPESRAVAGGALGGE